MMEQEKKAKPKHKKEEDQPVDLTKLVSGAENEVLIDLESLNPTETQSPYQSLIEGYQGILLTRSNFARYVVKGFTPGAQYNLLWYNNYGFSTYAVTDSKIIFLSRSELRKEIKDEIEYGFSSGYFNLVENILWISFKTGYPKSIRLELDPTTGRALDQRIVPVKNSQVAQETSKITKKFGIVRKNSKRSNFALKVRYLAGPSYGFSMDIGELIKDDFQKMFEMRSPSAVNRPDGEEGREFFSRTPYIEKYQYEKQGMFIMILFFERFILLNIYSSNKKKVLIRKCIDVAKLLNKKMGGEWLTDTFRIQPTQMIYMPSSKKLFFLFKNNKTIYLASISHLFFSSLSKFEMKKIDQSKQFSGQSLSLIGRGDHSRILYMKAARNYHKIGNTIDDKVLIVDPSTLEILHDLSLHFYKGKNLPMVFLEDLKIFRIRESDRLLIAGGDFSALLELGQNSVSRIIQKRWHLIG